jgi:hypothetical protein
MQKITDRSQDTGQTLHRVSHQKSMPAAPPGGGADMPSFFFGTSATIASVVIRRPATDAASCNAERTTLVGSIMPRCTRFAYSPV